MARQLARFADVPARDVGYAGLKDRHAITRQWFSVPRWNAPDWNALEVDGVAWLELAEQGPAQRLGGEIGGEAVRLRVGGCEAGAVDGDAVALPGVLCVGPVDLDLEPRAEAAALEAAARDGRADKISALQTELSDAAQPVLT